MAEHDGSSHRRLTCVQCDDLALSTRSCVAHRTADERGVAFVLGKRRATFGLQPLASSARKISRSRSTSSGIVAMVKITSPCSASRLR